MDCDCWTLLNSLIQSPCHSMSLIFVGMLPTRPRMPPTGILYSPDLVVLSRETRTALETIKRRWETTRSASMAKEESSLAKEKLNQRKDRTTRSTNKISPSTPDNFNLPPVILNKWTTDLIRCRLDCSFFFKFYSMGAYTISIQHLSEFAGRISHFTNGRR